MTSLNSSFRAMLRFAQVPSPLLVSARPTPRTLCRAVGHSAYEVTLWRAAPFTRQRLRIPAPRHGVACAHHLSSGAYVGRTTLQLLSPHLRIGSSCYHARLRSPRRPQAHIATLLLWLSHICLAPTSLHVARSCTIWLLRDPRSLRSYRHLSGCGCEVPPSAIIACHHVCCARERRLPCETTHTLCTETVPARKVHLTDS